MEKAGAFFGAPPRLARGVSDSAGVLTAGEARRIKRAIRAFERRFPQTGFTVALLPLGKDTPGATYTYWVFNRSNPAGELQQGRDNRHLFVLVDTASRGAWMTVGYGLEPFIGERHLQQCLGKAQPQFAQGRFAAGVEMLLAATESVFREVIGTLPRVYGFPRPDAAPLMRPAGKPQPAASW